MIVMSVVFRTRGSMPGAIRSEIIVRSSACAAMRNPLGSEDRLCANLGRELLVAQERGQELRPRRDRGNAHVFVGGMGASSLGAEAVDDGHAERADEVAVGA